MTDTSELEIIENSPPFQHEQVKIRRGTLNQASSTERMFSACAGALVTSTLMTPLDVVKTRLQSQEATGYRHLNGTTDGLVKIMRIEGPLALFRGLSAGLVMAIPSTVIYFVGYDYIRDHIRQSRFGNTAVHDYSPLWAGGVARTVAAAVISPIELFRTRMQAVEGADGFPAVWRGIMQMVQREGMVSLWRGLLPTMLRDVPFSGLYWMGYEQIKQYLSSKNSNQDTLSNFQSSFIAGASSGMFAAVVTTPFDVIKTQRQVNSGDDARIMRLIRKTRIAEGYRGFFRGVVPRVVKVAPSCAIMISSYEVGKRFFAERRDNQQQQHSATFASSSSSL
ncbi:mitochondrial carrier domain-containing protein [Zychaea mexicana]|uniref:mitochondrial carrier domain-containing protein n=1 Tax=Zychaea mexicana TaxID=64656 RepID=UPI0022FDF926|nr:mitochondrial carrier domain-containing protein [Zychaea mexicana]KAI9492711.1 mitochondrial carrier domain-containing protein [Zychaea mexicana]